MRIITANVNGVRAAARKGGMAQLLAQEPDVITLQEVRANSAQLAETLAEHGFDDWSAVHAPCRQAGRNGVALVSESPITTVRTGLPGFEDDGRWIEGSFVMGQSTVTVVSAYVPKGHVGEPPQERKMLFLSAMTARMSDLLASGGDVVVTGDINIARTALDLKNWKQRIGRSGFLAEEREFLDAWESAGWVDLGRALGGSGPGPYTWWSQRGRAFDNDSGWRIDYVWATPRLAECGVTAHVLRASSWDSRWSDHAALVVDFA